MKKKCYECKQGRLKTEKVEYDYCGVNLGRFSAEVCNSCGQQFFSEETSDRIEDKAKRAGVWGLGITTRVGRSGNTLDIRIAKPLADFVGLSKGKEVLIRPEGRHRLVIEVDYPG